MFLEERGYCNQANILAEERNAYCMSTERPHFKPSICAENEIIFNCSAHNTQMQLEIYFSMHDL